MYMHQTYFFFSSRRRHTRCALVTGVQTCALPISAVAASRNRPYGDAPHVRCLIPCPPTRMRVRYHPARKPRDSGITRCDPWRIAEVQHRRAPLGPLLAYVAGAASLVPGDVGVCEFSRFVLDVLGPVEPLLIDQH